MIINRTIGPTDCDGLRYEEEKKMLCKKCGKPIYAKGISYIGPACHCAEPVVLR